MTIHQLKTVSILVAIMFIFSCKTEHKREVNQKDIISIKIDSLLRVCNEREIFNGNAIVSINDTIIYKKSIGYKDGFKTNNLNHSSIFSIGSIAKEFNAISIMMLKEKGLLSFDQTINEFDLGLPEWSKKIKIKHLLQYSSGLPQVDYKNVKNDNDVYSDLKNLEKLNFEPGSNYQYNNNSIFLQKRIIEKITQKSFEEFVINNIISPLNLKNAIFNPKEENENYVKAFNNKGINDETSQSSTSGWLHLTNEDLHTYVNALHSEKLISNNSLHELFKNKIQGKQSSLGNGIFRNHELISHTHHGSHYNFEAFIYHNKESKLTVTLATNNKNFKLREITGAIENIIQNKGYETPQKSVYLTIREACYEDVDEGIKFYSQLKKNFRDTYNFSNSNELNRVGYKLIEKGQIKDAIKIFELMVREFPDDSNAYDSLGEAYMLDKQYEPALKNYKKSFELNPKNTNAEQKIAEINSLIHYQSNNQII
jgi:CubicO group peptidase (beta-lactamase class C family)